MLRWSSLVGASACLWLVVLIVAKAPSPALMAAQGQAPAGLPDGEARALTEAMCLSCHPNANLITQSSGYTREGWLQLNATMVDLPDATAARIADYLAEHFPPNTRRQPTLIPGDVSVTFREWVTPTLGQRSRDPLQAIDGSIWWTGQWASLVGQIDPRTGEMREYPLPDGARPHTVVEDAAGNIWYTGNGNGTVGRLDSATGEVTEFPMPDPAARDPHSAKFDHDGNLWFTLQQSNMVGRLVPATGDVTLFTLTRTRSLPYGIQVSSDGVVWVCFQGTNGFASFDTRTLEMREHFLPNEDTRIRRLALASDDTIWYADNGRGSLGWFDPKTGESKEWASPSGPRSHPYAIAVVNGIVWYNESGQRPDTLVRFDPRTETFQSWAIPSGEIHAGIIRNMRVTREGNLVIHQSSTNRIGLVEIHDGRSTSR